jgi:cytochrome c5
MAPVRARCDLPIQRISLAKEGVTLMNADRAFDSRTPSRTSAAGALATALVAVAVAVAVAPALAQQGAKSGQQVVTASCAGCHASGKDGAPKIGDSKAWSARAAAGLSALTQTALTGIRRMPAHGGGPGLSDLEIRRAIIVMVNQSGGHWVEPIDATKPAAVRGGEQVVQAQCSKCHQDGTGGAPRIGDRVAWAPRLKNGLDATVRSAIHGHGGMPARGGMADLSDVEIRNAVTYMFDPGAAAAPAK